MKSQDIKLTLVAVAVALLLFLLVALAVRGCSGGSNVVVISNGGIDAGPGEALIAARLDAEVRAAEAQMLRIEQKFDADLAAFDAQQREEYARLRDGDDLEAAAQFLSDWSRTRRGAR